MNSKKSGQCRIYVVIANFGSGNDAYLDKVINEYRLMQFEIDITVVTTIKKDFGRGVNVFCKPVPRNPWAFPFYHKELIAQKVDQYDYYIYSEDDMLVTEDNVSAFIRAQTNLNDNEIAGYLRFEKNSSDDFQYCDIYKHWHWDPFSVVKRGDELFAYLTNEHSAFYLLTNSQLKKAVTSRKYLVAPYRGRYNFPETAATDLYTSCGFKKLVCISRPSGFLIHHLPNKYCKIVGATQKEFMCQIEALKRTFLSKDNLFTLVERDVLDLVWIWGKSYYEDIDPGAYSEFIRENGRMLSYGCGSGRLEEKYIKQGCKVDAVPVDCIIGECANLRGVEIVYDSFSGTIKDRNRYYDIVLINDILHLIRNPDKVIKNLCLLLSKDKQLIVRMSNQNILAVIVNWLKNKYFIKVYLNWRKKGLNRMTYQHLKNILLNNSMKIIDTQYECRESRVMKLPLMRKVFAKKITVFAAKIK